MPIEERYMVTPIQEVKSEYQYNTYDETRPWLNRLSSLTSSLRNLNNSVDQS